jgi:hypothetical protein
MALLSGSPAIDASDPSFDTAAASFDQRGSNYTRKSGSAIDIGAFELQIAPPAPADLTIVLSNENYQAILVGEVSGDWTP